MGTNAMGSGGYPQLKDLRVEIEVKEGTFSACFWVYLMSSTAFPATIIQQVFVTFLSHHPFLCQTRFLVSARMLKFQSFFVFGISFYVFCVFLSVFLRMVVSLRHAFMWLVVFCDMKGFFSFFLGGGGVKLPLKSS